MAANRPHLQTAAFARSVVDESTNPVVCPAPLNDDEREHYIGFYNYRRSSAWRHGELLVLVEMSRLAVKIEQTSHQLSIENFENATLLAQYERLIKMRNELRRQVNLVIPATEAKTLTTQKLAANQIMDGLNGKLNAPVQKPAKIKWDEVLNV